MTSTWRADLHTHTTCSDGTLTPAEVIQLAKASGLQALSITDHDTTAAFPEAFTIAKECEIAIISGVELSCVQEGETIHILGYAFDPDSKSLLESLQKQRQHRLERNRRIIEKLKKEGIVLEENEIQDPSKPADTYGRVHIADVLVKKGYVADILEAFKRYIGNNKPCYVESSKWAVEEGIETIHQAGGLAVLAHPHLIASSSICKKVLEMPFDGIEAYYSRMPMSSNDRWIKVAQSKGCFVTGGSDFHGDVKPDIRLGCSFTPQEVFLRLHEHFLRSYNVQ